MEDYVPELDRRHQAYTPANEEPPCAAPKKFTKCAVHTTTIEGF
jgi:hypothetical protein